ncbi:acetyl/propionyl/methylcrotonyl-CoA carboxylase subunit alpha [Curvivirga aplysinae]|uniref:acetyl/propionyl/methylcrotonyl-CoA carboxylase subunit alpha n=1 Tax=Curvivirga aplysinae TaxID=2529852 RepID=UPI0012BC59F4|nr:acetyl/propionyl/methylcrotonyl-CoA carboxylase subunit alpha [Curvivirga aplysinae]MTI09185.1 acetyl/propionyl/methylcrotonyl-CoA carboxylase subunit alpha [Curvivirga aplysinae]
MFTKVLIANRGEIAVRVIKTAREMGIASVAVYSDADANAMHVAMADEAVHLGPAPARESYLIGEKVIQAALDTGAEAIHPGYGFLSENAEFADAVEAAGLIFIGPTADAIRAMGSKSAAKELMGGASVPLVPGYHGDNQDADFLKSEADKIGYPVLIKASAGGGGKGMRLVEKTEDFLDALDSCKREAISSFGDDLVLIEKFVTNPRHIEMQVFADEHGNAVHLFERDCSIQRRHQKVIEEAPAPGLPADLQAEMGKAAVAAAKAIQYRGAGTIEFIADCEDDGTPRGFYFMEMNTRLQVEHPVTEMITGQDLVSWQFKVASGEELPLTQEDLSINGHSMEVRLYAEDPDGGFLPAIGHLDYLELPEDIARIDTGVRTGDDVSMHYDPMIAKIIVHGEDRDAAIRKLAQALANSKISGVTTNRDFLGKILEEQAFQIAKLDTGFIERYEESLLPDRSKEEEAAARIAMLAMMLEREIDADIDNANTDDPWSPWASTDHWRLNDIAHSDAILKGKNAEFKLAAMPRDGGFDIALNDEIEWLSGDYVDDVTLAITNGDWKGKVSVIVAEDTFTVITEGGSYPITLFDPVAAASQDEGGSDRLAAPMPGKVTAVHASNGDDVEEGQLLMVLEAMKMEHSILAPHAGKIDSIRFGEGDQVADGDVLVTFLEE